MVTQRWTARDTAGYVDYSNNNYGSFMNAHACHPFDASETNPDTVNALASVVNATVTAPVSGNYYLTAAADNFGTGYIRRSVGGVTTQEDVTFAGLGSNTGASTNSIYFNSGDTITIFGYFYNAPATGGFDTNPCAVAMVLYGPDDPVAVAPTASLTASPSSVCPGVNSTLTWSSTDASSANLTDPDGTSISTSTSNSTGLSVSKRGTYTLSVSGDGGSASDTATVTERTATGGSFSGGTSATINLGDSFELAWTATGYVTSVLIDQGVGNVTSDADKKYTVTPTVTTEYTLTINGCSTITSKFTVNVNQPGCMDPDAENYDSTAGVDTGGCSYGGDETLGSLRLFDEFFRYDGATDTFYTAFPNGELGGNLSAAYKRNARDVWNLFETSTSKGVGDTVVAVYRFWNPTEQNHFYTANATEASIVAGTDGWNSEGVPGYAYSSDGDNRIAVYRHYNSQSAPNTDHKYLTTTTSPSGYTYEGVAWYSPIVVTGCGDSAAVNYDIYVNQDTDTGCSYAVFGCTDSEADNYNADATDDDGSCIFSGCTDSEADNYWAKANNDDGSCIFSGCTDSLANNYWPKANNDDGSCTYDLPVISLSITGDPPPTSIILGESITLSYSATGAYLTTATLTDVTAPGFSGTATVTPALAGTKTYTYAVTGAGGSISTFVSILVYEPPVLYMFWTDTGDTTHSIIAGNSTNLEWYVSGDCDTITWTEGDITSGILSSSQSVSPSETTRYSAYVSGSGGTSATVTAILTVYQLPELTVTYPENFNYGVQGTIQYTAKYVNTSLSITPTYTYLEGDVVVGDTIDLNRPNSAENGVGVTEVTDTYTTTIPYTQRGPLFVSFAISGSGEGGSVSSSNTIPVIIDITPENLAIEESDDLLASQPNVINPQTSEALTDQYLIDDIDIDVEIKSDYPIQIQVNNSGTWDSVREI